LYRVRTSSTPSTSRFKAPHAPHLLLTLTVDSCDSKAERGMRCGINSTKSIGSKRGKDFVLPRESSGISASAFHKSSIPSTTCACEAKPLRRAAVHVGQRKSPSGPSSTNSILRGDMRLLKVREHFGQSPPSSQEPLKLAFLWTEGIGSTSRQIFIAVLDGTFQFRIPSRGYLEYSQCR
jgi:hypothetical protein